METLDFSTNWNNKLDCDFYTTIRLRNDVKYQPGKEYMVKLKSKEHHKARCVAVTHTNLYLINDFVAGVDMGLSKAEGIELIQSLYKNQGIDWRLQPLSLILLQRLKDKTNEKIALWCTTYERYCGVKYKVNGKEAKQIQKYDITEPLLKAYFESAEWWAAQKSLTGYMTHYNEVRRVSVQGTGRKWPNGWDKIFEQKLSPPELTEYWRHLRSIGLEPKKNAVGNTIDWIPKQV